MSYILRSTKFVRYFFGLARSIVTSNRQEIDGGLLQKNHNLAALFSKNLSLSHLSLQTRSHVDETVRQLDEDARRTGRVTLSEIGEALNTIKNSRQATASQSLMVIRCCGNLVPEETPEQRTKLVEEIWKTFEKIGVPLDISHYNALLKVYLENEHKFSPTEFLARLDENGIEPNRVTYQRLIAGFCQQGDIAGATKILEFMKDKQLPVSEGVFNALILGHSKADDMESAEGILNVMKQANLEPSNETYATLMAGYAARGDIEAIQRLLTDCKVKDILLSDRELLDISYAAAINNHDGIVDELLKNIRRSLGYNQDAANVIIRLVTAGKDESAYKVFLSLNPVTRLRDDSVPNMSGHIFIKHLVKCNRPVDQIMSWCERLSQDGHTAQGLHIAVDSSFYHNNTDLTLDLLRVMKQRQEPVRAHYFWPSLATAGKAKDFDRVLEIVSLMDSEFGLTINSETLKDYIMPYVPPSKSVNEILESLSNVGVKRGQAVVGMVSCFVNKKKPKEAADLAMQYPTLNYSNYLTSKNLVELLQSTGDAASVISLLHVMSQNPYQASREDKDEEDEKESADELIHRFFINCLSSTSCQNFLPDILKEMLNHNLPINNACAVMIENKLQGKQLTPEVSELLAKLSSGQIISQPLKSSGSGTVVRTPESLLRVKEKMKASNEPNERLIGINRSLYLMYCRAGDVDNALVIKQELNEEYKEETTPGMWAALLEAYCSKNDLEGAKSCLKNIQALSETFELDADKILKLAKLYVENNQIDEATALLKSVKPREREAKEDGFQSRIKAWNLLQAVVDTYKDPAAVKQMLELLKEQKYIEVNNIMLGAVVKAHLVRDDLMGALKEFEECVKLHRATPYKNELTIKFIEKEDAANLQTIVDLSTQVHGEINSLYDLVLAFIECGKIRQARKILETPGLGRRSNRISLACERYKKDGKVEYLEALVEATKDVALIDRSEIYSKLLDTYCESDEVEKALGLWTKMQDEDVNASDEFLIKLGNFLKEKGQNVPFKIPEQPTYTIKRKEAAKANEKGTSPRQERINNPPLLQAIQNKNVDEALKIKDELDVKGQRLTRREAGELLELLVAQSRLRDATAFVTSLSVEQMPIVRTLNFLITRLTAKGETDLLQRVGDHLSEDLKKRTSFSNRLLTSAVANGKAKEQLDKMEKEIDAASSDDDFDKLTGKFPRGGIMAVLENCPSDHDQVVRIVEKFCSKGYTSPANCLAMHYLATGDKEKAQQVFEKHNLKNSSQLMFRSVLSKARVAQDPKIVEDLLSMVKDAPAVTPDVMSVIYSNLINIYSTQNNFDTALEKLEEGLKKIPLEMFYTTTLQRLKEGLEANNKTFKYTIPPRDRRQKESTSSSSSSETEPKKSVASN
ncbi:leucine-rich PPR motif-containing protein, mitochondrial isoform X2 [Macrosteles quadrilineatus]|uniref:leucine-rich PPR motif-containing protein, mitochondrial isoform X2 n=1 Tax=Macrosteles quadrilineatus TaxID=74068 RepID=UPI0023E1A7A7|nr:leucine-rich PPR motif-containing protein, mitochondrial isoform X2 [Macrosteles quadrilineatus]